MIKLWALLFLLHKTLSHEVTEQLDDVPNNATTTLYAVSVTPPRANNGSQADAAGNESVKQAKFKTEATVWKVETAFAESSLAKKEEDSVKGTEIDDSKRQNRSEAFKPSQHLGDVFDIGSVEGLPSSFSKDSFHHFSSLAKKPSEGYKGLTSNPKKFPTAPSFPYKFDSHKDPWGPTSPAKGAWGPTIGALPAGGLYKSPDPFGDKPAGEDGDFGLDFKGELAFKEQGLHHKRRANPWQGIVQMLTALIPTALIVSALTPTIINVEHIRKPFQRRLSRRSTPPEPPQPLQAPITERCRRRLLCELQAEEHYKQSSSKSRQLSYSCRRHRCEDPSTLAPLITWLLQPRHRTDGPARGNKVK